jgi:surface polysaccharide O-acyltransferase-like enzyme
MKTSVKNRDSNFELLRLVCMLYILLMHFLGHGLNIVGNDGGGGGYSIIAVTLKSFFIVAVNCFVLISGYFQIKPKFSNFIHLYLMCVFYQLIPTVFSGINNNYFNIKKIVFSFLPFWRSYLWFIPCYFHLCFLSPIINKLITGCNKKEYLSFLVLCFILNVIYNFFNPSSNRGFDIINFIFLYLIGRFIQLYVKNETSAKIRMLFLLTYTMCSLLLAILVIYIFNSDIDSKWANILGFSYNSPLVIISAIAFFCFFRTIRLQSKVVNWLAASVLAIYLIHENPVISAYLYQYVRNIDISNDYLLGIYLFLLSVFIMVICIFIDKIR